MLAQQIEQSSCDSTIALKHSLPTFSPQKLQIDEFWSQICKLSLPQSLPTKERTLGCLSNALRKQQYFDINGLDTSGAIVALPNGMSLLHRMHQIVRENYLSCGLEEYSYPVLIPYECIKPSEELMDLNGRVLKIAADSNSRDFILTPSGESAIYSHWRKVIKHKDDLPLKMFQQTRYFRPRKGKAAGFGIFSTQEAADVFELHCAYRNRSSAEHDRPLMLKTLSRILEQMQLPAVWSVRPLWENNSAVSECTFAADVLMPSNTTIQVGCLYTQAQRFSDKYRISYKDSLTKKLTFHLSGAVSRRLIYSHLFLGLREDDTFLIHPNIAPIQVATIFVGENESEERLCFEKSLSSLNIRHRIYSVASMNSGRALLKRLHSQSVPIILLYFLPNKVHKKSRIAIFRNDRREEADFFDLDQIGLVVSKLLESIGQAYNCMAYSRIANHYRFAKTFSELRLELEKKQLIEVPLRAEASATAQITKLNRGEVLGFVSSDTTLPCCVTGQLTNIRAFISGRI